MWARLLEDGPFLEWFIAENQKRLAKHYTLLTEFLDQDSIPYYKGGNAAVFLWIDLRKVLRGDRKDMKTLRVTNPDAGVYKDMQDRLIQLWLERGVMIARGSGSLSEEYGWFRIVFTAEEQALHIGLDRFLAVLKDWQSKDE